MEIVPWDASGFDSQMSMGKFLYINKEAGALQPSYDLKGSMLLGGDAYHVLERLPSECIQSVITSPPYWGMRDYTVNGQIGLEETLPQFLNRLVVIFREVRRILKPDGTFWLNIGDGYTSGNRGWRAPDKKNPARAMAVRPSTPDGLKPKDLLGLPWRLAFALQQDGWYLRSDIVWNKPNAMPESVKDRPTRSHEYLFMLSKSEKYYYDCDAIREQREDGLGTRNKRSVWSVNTEPSGEAHFATFPPRLITPCILASTRPNDYVLDPFFGSGTVGLVCQTYARNYVGIELNPAYLEMAARRLSRNQQTVLPLQNQTEPAPSRPPDRVLSTAEDLAEFDSSGFPDTGRLSC